MGTDQGYRGYRSGISWVQIRDIVGTDQGLGIHVDQSSTYVYRSFAHVNFLRGTQKVTFYFPIGHEMVNLVANGCKFLKVNHFPFGKFLLLSNKHNERSVL